MAAMTVVFAPVSGWLVGNRGPRLPLILAGTMLAASGLILAQLTTRLSGPLETGFVPAAWLGWWIIAGCGALVLVLGLITAGR